MPRIALITNPDDCAIVEAKALPDQIAGPADDMHNPNEAPEAEKTTSSHEVVKYFFSMFEKAVFENGLTTTLRSTVQTNCQLLLLRLGAGPPLQMAERPPYYKLFLMPALIAIQDGVAMIKSRLPMLGQKVNFTEYNDTLSKLIFYRQIRGYVGNLLYGIDAVISNLEQRLFKTASTIYKETLGEQQENYGLRQVLEPLNTLMEMAAQTAQDSKKKAEKIRKDTEAETLLRVKETMTEAEAQGPAAPPTPTPTPTPNPVPVPPPVKSTKR